MKDYSDHKPIYITKEKFGNEENEYWKTAFEEQKVCLIYP
jgi:hypothetical protein